jgi:hypothetical protein
VELAPEQLENILMCLTDQGIELLESDQTPMAEAPDNDGEGEAPALDLTGPFGKPLTCAAEQRDPADNTPRGR